MKKPSAKKECWYTFKSLYRMRVSGRPKRKGKFYDAKIEAVEERIVLIKAISFPKAESKLRREAKTYARYCNKVNQINYFGEKITTEFLGWKECYQLFDPPGDGIEVYSHTITINRKTKNKELLAENSRFAVSVPETRVIRFIDMGVAEKLLEETTLGKPRK